MPHHLYVCPVNSVELRRHPAFRDALHGREDFRAAYGKLKLSIAQRSGGDRRIYAQIKEIECRPFVERVLRETPNSPAITRTLAPFRRHGADLIQARRLSHSPL